MAKENDVDMLEFLLNEGAQLNLPEHKQGYPSALMDALGYDALEAVSYLLGRGADPNSDRTLIRAINSKRHALEFVKLLVEHGANINERFDFGRAVVTPLSWAIATGKADVSDYLRSLEAELPVQESTSAREELSSEVVAYFEQHVGSVSPLTLIEIIPSGTPVTVHVIPAMDGRDCVTFFTTGMSEHPMTVPTESSAEEYRFAELYIQLPGDWPITGSIEDPKYAWPLRWLRYLGAYPSMENTWLGGPVAVVTVGEPPLLVDPAHRFDSMLLLADRNFQRKDGQIVQLYRLFPLYPGERELERRDGIAALMRAFDRHSIGFICDVKRRSVA
jgi:hypothetical protein